MKGFIFFLLTVSLQCGARMPVYWKGQICSKFSNNLDTHVSHLEEHMIDMYKTIGEAEIVNIVRHSSNHGRNDDPMEMVRCWRKSSYMILKRNMQFSNEFWVATKNKTMY